MLLKKCPSLSSCSVCLCLMNEREGQAVTAYARLVQDKWAAACGMWRDASAWILAIEVKKSNVRTCVCSHGVLCRMNMN